MNRFVISSMAVASLASAASAQFNTLTGAPPLVIGHRGASGYLPEHTLESYTRAIELGADFIEPDLVATSDGVLIARHEPTLSGTTNVADLPQFAARRTTKVLDGVPTTDWFASDFTLAEIRTLRARQPRADRPQEFNDQYVIPTFAEIITLAQSRGVGIYPETKHPTFHDNLGLSLEEPLLAALSTAGWNNAAAPVFIQSFESSNLRQLNQITNVRLVQLIDANDVNNNGTLDLTAPYDRPYDFAVAGDTRTFADLLTPGGLDFVNDYADGIGPWKPYLLTTAIFDPNNDGIADDRNGDGVVNISDRVVLGDSGVITRAHAAGLLVHGFTFRNDSSLYGFSNPLDEYRAYYALGIDGVFSDFPDTARAAIPAPASVGLLGLAGLAALRRRR